MKLFLKILLLSLFFFLLISIPMNGQIIINEFMSDNGTTFADEDGDFPDWIELYNTSNSSVNLADYSLSDNDDELDKWSFPSLTIPANSFLLVFASGKDRVAVNELHTNFKISSSGEALFLSNNLGQVIDQIEAVELAENKSYGRLPDGADNFLSFFISTPNTSNNVNNQLTFEYNGGFYEQPFYQKITSLTGDDIYYTLDGSVPTDTATIFSDSLMVDYKYAAPNVISHIPTTPHHSLISLKAWEVPNGIIDKATVLRFASYKNGVRTSKIHTHTYLVDSTIFEKYEMPIISLVTDAGNLFDYDYGICVPGVNYDTLNPQWTGNYFRRGDDWERPVHIEYYEKNGSLGFSQDAGIKVHGGKSRQGAQKSFKLFARDEYGKKSFDYPLMPHRPHDKYERFILRATMGTWSNTLLNDVFGHEIARGMGLNYQDYRPAVIFINGEYWGIETIRDKIDERYIGYSYDLDADSVEIRGFTNGDYFELEQYIRANDLADDLHYEYVKTKIDIENFIDYHILEMYSQNGDWPANNIELWKEKNENGKWKWLFYDVDGSFAHYDYNMFEHMTATDSSITHPNSLSSTFMYRNLMKNQNFENQFITRYAELLNNEFQTDTLDSTLNELMTWYEPEIPRHFERWSYEEDIPDWKNTIDESMRTFIKKRPCVVRKNIIDFFDLSSFDFDCVEDEGEEEENLYKGFLLAPNPNTGDFFIYNSSPEDMVGELIITNILGRTMYSGDNFSLEKNEKVYFDFSDWANNTYFLIYRSEDFREVKKFVLMK